MALPQGIDFRGTSTYVTDPANYDYSLTTGQLVYPWTTAQGNSVGWEISAAVIFGADKNSSNDPRIAGYHHPDTNATEDFRIDLPSSGDYKIGLASGSQTYAVNQSVELFDTSSSLGSLASGSTSAPQRFKDATNTEYTDATWPTSQTLVTKTFTTTICRFRVGLNKPINSVYVEAAASGLGRLIATRPA